MKIKLIFPPSLSNYCQASLGLPHLKSFIQKQGYTIEIFDSNFLVHKTPRLRSLLQKICGNKLEKHLVDITDLDVEYFSKRILGIVNVGGADLIGFSVPSYSELKTALCLAKKTKELNAKAKIVFGGSFLTLYNHTLLEDFDFIDYVIHGYGELSLLGLIKFLNKEATIEKAPGLIHRKNNEIIRNKNFVFDLEKQSAPDFSDLPLNLYPKGLNAKTWIPYFIADGCKKRCAFCVHWQYNKEILFKSPAKIINDLRKLSEKYRVRNFALIADAINFDKYYLINLCDLIIKNKLKIHWYSDAILDKIDKNLISKLKKSGCRGLIFGLESASPTLLKKMNKNIDISKVINMLQGIKRADIKVRLNLIIGFPGETHKEFYETCHFILKNHAHIDVIKVSKFSLMKGSSIFLNAEKYGLKNISNYENGLFSKYCPNYQYMEKTNTEPSEHRDDGFKIEILKKLAKKTAIKIMF